MNEQFLVNTLSRLVKARNLFDRLGLDRDITAYAGGRYNPRPARYQDREEYVKLTEQIEAFRTLLPEKIYQKTLLWPK